MNSAPPSSDLSTPLWLVFEALRLRVVKYVYHQPIAFSTNREPLLQISVIICSYL